MTIVPRTGPLSASSALATTSWYHLGKSSDFDVNTALAMGGRGYRDRGERGPKRSGGPELRAAQRPGPILASADGVPPRRRRPDRTVQLAVRPQHRWDVRAADRGHRPRPLQERPHRGHP